MALAPQSDDADTQSEPQALTGMERRMNIRAFDYWESLLEGRDFPSVGDLDPEAIAPFREHSLLIDFTNGYDAPVLRYVGSHLRAEASLANREIDPNDVPSGTLLSRLTNHYLEILANRSPIGFEAEYENDADERVSYRGILLPLSDDGTTINFIYGAVSWMSEDILPGEESAGGFDDDVIDLDAPVDPEDAELLELTQALDDADTESLLSGKAADSSMGADDKELQSLVSEIDEAMGISPAAGLDAKITQDIEADTELEDEGDLADLSDLEDTSDDLEENEADALGMEDDFLDMQGLEADLIASNAAEEALEDTYDPASDDLGVEDIPVSDDLDDPALETLPPVLDGDDELFDMLAQCQTKAADLARFDSRSRAALYETLSLGYDFHLVSQRRQEAYQDLLEKTGISVQTRAPVTPIVKLIFGQAYDKTRVTEYAAALGYADREGVPQGEFQAFVESFEGGIKAMVKAERAARNSARGNHVIDQLEAAKTTLRSRPALMTLDADAVSAGGDDEFVLMVARRDASGGYAVLDAVKTGKSTLEAALKKVAQSKEKSGD